MRTIPLLSAVVLAAIAVVTAPADAAIISATYTVVGSGFTGPVAPPYASITESFTITFDTTKTVSQQTTSISLAAGSTIVPTSPLGFTYVAGIDTLIVGGTAATVTTSDLASMDFALTIGSASNVGNFTVTALSYSIGQGAVFTASSAQRGTAVPEPASLAILAATSLAFLMTRRRA